MEDLDRIRKEVKRDFFVEKGDIDRAIELTYKKISEQLIRKLKNLARQN